MIKVSVIIPVYNSEPFLAEAVDSALGQTYPDFEIILINDGSTDRSGEICQAYQNRYPQKIQYLYQENQGPAAARNTGIRKASGEYIALLDADDIWLPDRLEVGMKIAEENKHVGLVHGNIAYIDSKGLFLCDAQRKKQFLKEDMFPSLFLRREHIACPTVLLRKECLDQIGCFDQAKECIGLEDRDLWLRLSKTYKIKYVDTVMAQYRLSDQSLSQSRQRMLDGRTYLINKFCPPGEKRNRFFRRRAFGSLYRDMGDEYLLEGQFQEAKKDYLKSIRWNPVSFWPWVNYLKALFHFKGRA